MSTNFDFRVCFRASVAEHLVARILWLRNAHAVLGTGQVRTRPTKALLLENGWKYFRRVLQAAARLWRSHIYFDRVRQGSALET